MKKIILAVSILVIATSSQAQYRKHTADFTALRQHYNPALTALSGPQANALYRNQWAGIDGAPTTLFISAEADLADIAFLHRSADASESGDAGQEGEVVRAGISHGVGLSILRDKFGPFGETEISVNYRSRVNLSEKIGLHAGGSVVYHAQTLDGKKLSAEEAADPSVIEYSGRTGRSGRMDFKIGLALSGEDFYLAYALHNLRGGASNEENEDYFKANTAREHAFQGGYRKAVSDVFGVVVNAMYRYDRILKETFDTQVKGVFYNTAWVGIGYRNSLAYSLSVGMRMSRFRVGYAHEIPTGDAHRLGGINEITLGYDLRDLFHPTREKKLTVW